MVNHGTRVWEAMDAAGNVVVIKDSWRDEDRDAEVMMATGSCRGGMCFWWIRKIHYVEADWQ